MTAVIDRYRPGEPVAPEPREVELFGLAPADLVDPVVGGEQSTVPEARARAERIRAGLPVFVQMRRDIADAYGRRDWATLGYDSWEQYLDSEFGGQLRRLVGAERREAVAEYREAGMSSRAIAKAVGASQSAVRNDLAQLSTSTQLPDRVVGRDGKDRPAARPEADPKANGLGVQHGPTPGTDVWVPGSQGDRVEAHRPNSIDAVSGDRYTTCNKRMRNGVTVPAAEATEKWRATWCLKCWPLEYPLVLVRQEHEAPLEAELREDEPGRKTVKVVYTRSRTAAWVARERIIRPGDDDKAGAAAATVTAPVLEAQPSTPTSVGPSPETPAPPAPSVAGPAAGSGPAGDERVARWRRRREFTARVRRDRESVAELADADVEDLARDDEAVVELELAVEELTGLLRRIYDVRGAK